MPPNFRNTLALGLCLCLAGCSGPSPDPLQPPVPPSPPQPQGPFFLAYPVDQTVNAGQWATFACSASGSGPIQYQWRQSGVVVQGANGPSYTVPSASLDEDGSTFTVNISSPFGSATSPPATLHVQVWLPSLPIVAIQASLPDGPSLVPGQQLPLVLTLTQASGPPLLTSGRGGGKIGWDNFTFQSNLVHVSPAGIVNLPADPRLSDGATPSLTATIIDRPDLTTTLAIPVRYDGNFAAEFSGSAGSGGSDGSPGYPGVGGSPGSCDPDFPLAGGNGSDGGQGGGGSDGGTGSPGADIQAWVTLHPGQAVLLEVKVVSQGQTLYFLVDPNGGSLQLKCNGGDGGPGGSGGTGGSGGPGGFGCPNGGDGQSGFSGPSGSGGTGGNGGSISITADPGAVPYLSALQLSNAGGSPGGLPGPTPTIQTAAVAPLWTPSGS